MKMTGIHICPRCGGTVFTTPVKVEQTWRINSYGAFISVKENSRKVVARPSDNNWWTCCTCGAEGYFFSEGYAPFTIPERYAKMDPKYIQIGFLCSVYTDDDDGSGDTDIEVKPMPVAELYEAGAYKERGTLPPGDALVTRVTVKNAKTRNAKVFNTVDKATFNAMSFDWLLTAIAQAWPQMAQSFIPKSMYSAFHEMYLELVNLQAILESGCPDGEDETELEDRKANIAWQLKTHGLDPDHEAFLLIPTI